VYASVNLPLHHSRSSLLALAHPGSPGKKGHKMVVVCGVVLPKISKSIHTCQSYSKPKAGRFFKTRCSYIQYVHLKAEFQDCLGSLLVIVMYKNTVDETVSPK